MLQKNLTFSKFTNLQTSSLQKPERLYNKNGVLRNYLNRKIS